MKAAGLVARGALLGALGGVAAGVVDFALAAERAAAFLPSGKWKLLLFLCSLYGAAGAATLAAAALLLVLLGWASDAGDLWREAFWPSPEPRTGARLAAYAVAVVAALAAIGVAVDLLTLQALRQFHHRVLIAALVGVTVSGLGLAATPLVLLLATLLSPLLRFGRRARLRLAAPAGVEAAAWLLGLWTAAGAVTALVLALEQRRRMLPAQKALNTALWAPLILLGALLLAHLVARLVPLRAAWLKTRRGALAAVALALLLPLIVAGAMQWPLLRQLDLRPFVALAIAVGVALAALFANAGALLERARTPVRIAVAAGLPPLLLAVALGIGRSDRVRKSATAFTGLAGPLVAAIHAATDLDRDGYSSVLGGGDCDDLDPEVHPGAFDWPDDGIDQNCNGHEATLQAAPRPPFATPPPSLPRDLNVVLITIDALRADHVGAYGYARPTTPRLDGLARESTLFTDAWAHAPSTRYSIPAIMIGRYPSAIATDANLHWPPRILPENRFLSEILKDRGYRTGMTASYGGSGYFEEGWGIFQGFDEYDVHLKSLHSLAGDPANTHGTSSRQLADLDIEWINAHKDQKFFFWSHFYDTHFAFERHPDMPESNFGDDEIDLYDGEIRFTDYHIGRVFDALKAAGLWDKTIIVITADHGDGFGEHGIPPNQRHGYHLYANETKVPLIIHVPSLPSGRVATPVAHIDIIPTLLNVLGGRAEDEPTLQGASALGAMLGRPPSPRPSVVFQEVTYEGPTSRYNGTQRRALVTSDWHLIRNVIPDATVELYRRSDDPAEQHDLAGLGDPAERTLMHQLAGWMDELDLPPDFARRTAGNVGTAPFAPQTPLGDRIGGWLVLDGVDVATPTVRAGDAAEVTLYWHATARAPAGWRLFTHLAGGHGLLNADHEPLQNAYPLARLRPGTYLRDRVRVVVPPGWPPGPLQVRVGLWRGAERAPVAGMHLGPERSLLAATLTVTP